MTFSTKAASHFMKLQTEAPVAVVAAALSIYDIPVDLDKWPSMTVWCRNEGGGSGDPLADIHIEVSPDGNAWTSLATEESALEQLTDTLAATATGLVMRLNHMCYYRARVVANCAGGNDTTVSLWVDLNQG